jgi:hypothetical protein
MADEFRKTKGITQKFYLINIKRNDQIWTITLDGLTNRYILNLSKDSLECNCPDYDRGQFCKHLYFIILKIAECYQILLNHDISDTRKVSPKDFEHLDQSLISKILEYQKNNKAGDDDENPSKRQKIIHECLICFEEIKEDQADKECLSQCHKHFHKSCLQRWLTINQNCPHCRSITSFQSMGYNYKCTYNPWNKIETMDIDILKKIKI